MNALFEEQNITVIEHSAEACLMDSVYKEMVLHHESLLLADLEKVAFLVGGSVNGHTVGVERGKD